MKKIYSFIVVMLYAQFIYAQTMIRTVGAGGAYTTLSAAISDINAGNLVGNIELQLISDITENLTSTLIIQKSMTGLTEYNSIQIYPTVPNVTLTFNAVNPITVLSVRGNGITFDGRLNKSGAPNNLTLEFNNKVEIGIEMRNKARYNKIQYCNINSESTAYTTGLITIGHISDMHTDTTNSNSFNSIKYNSFSVNNASDTSLVMSKVYIYQHNYADTILGNHFTKVSFDRVAPSSGFKADIRLLGKNYGTIISHNHFYEANDTISVRQSSNNNYFIYLNDTYSYDMYGYDIVKIDSNYFGGTEPFAGGSPMVVNGYGYYYTMFTPICTNGNAHITNNVIKNINIVNQQGVGLFYEFINLTNKQNVSFVLNNNIIGGPNPSDRINIHAHANSLTVDLMKIHHGNLTVANNILQNVRIVNIRPNSRLYFTGIHKTDDGVSGLSTTHITDNLIGSDDTESMIYINGGGVTTQSFRTQAIYLGTGVYNYVMNNVITGIIDSTSTTYVGTSFTNEPCGLYGIVSKVAGKVMLDNNIISNLQTINDRPDTLYTALSGILLYDDSAQQISIRNNRIENLIAHSNANLPYVVSGITSNQSTLSTVMVDSLNIFNNFIHNIINNSTNTAAKTVGVFLPNFNNKSTRYMYNNVIVLDSIPNPHNVYGVSMGAITAAGSSSNWLNVFHNTIHIDAGNSNAITACIHNVVTAKNNILSNTSTQIDGLKRHFAFFNAAVPAAELSPINNMIYLPNTGTRLFRSADMNIDDLATFKSNYPTDAYSVIANPEFVNVNGNTPQDFMATAATTSSLSYVTLDFDGTPRTIYYMGAFEDLGTPLFAQDINMHLSLTDAQLVQIDWSVTQEKNIQSYTILSSTDAQAWSAVASISATEANQYQYTDNAPLQGKRYYRIEANLVNAQSILSSIQWIAQHAPASINVYPNPNNGQFTIQATDKGISQVLIYNLQGQLVYQNTNVSAQSHINISALPAGLYITHITTDDKQTVVIKVNKN